MMNSSPRLDNARTLVLTGASRGIGHATVKKFSAGGWRVITVSRQPFSALCPWPVSYTHLTLPTNREV